MLPNSFVQIAGNAHIQSPRAARKDVYRVHAANATAQRSIERNRVTEFLKSEHATTSSRTVRTHPTLVIPTGVRRHRRVTQWRDLHLTFACTTMTSQTHLKPSSRNSGRWPQRTSLKLRTPCATLLASMEADRERNFRILLEDPVFGCLVHEIHYSFWVNFTVEELVRTETVGELFDLIASKQKQPMSGGCLSRTAFHRLRQAFVKALGFQRSEIRPQTPLAQLMPTRTRRAQWEKLSQELHLFIPELWYPIWLQILLAVGFIGTVVLVFGAHYFVKSADGAVAFMLNPLLWIPFWVAAVPAMIAPFKRMLPLQTVGELTNFIATHEHSSLVDQQGGWNQRDAMNTLRKLISEHTHIPVQQITPETRFPEDLGY